ncbi:phosphopantetheine-binding protein [Pseudomonas syringae group genomosp. 7]|uniref:phosphopantetheine-binding protein n=1 Tax=Pseudomonas syringae group genomosp. 7 TaxID=251699 RepID=UPI000F3EA401|nr:phosphopantetheine-binding protein [Pseudomonas syringae group genomosp. 7]RMR04840.1 Non-ribosomal peptide synthetase, initiating component [Pseudomonas syringae pv. helianthi]
MAYIASSVSEPDAAQLRKQLGKILPDYMQPSFYVVLAALPLSANGKIDRQALPPHEPIARSLARDYLVPTTATEKSLVSLWQETLKVPRVGINDSFFELGGHSLLATQILASVQQTFSVSLPLKRLFESS